jgi:NAD-dependent dihydropyrimidine dehydrogenase PreA subunit
MPANLAYCCFGPQQPILPLFVVKVVAEPNQRQSPENIRREECMEEGICTVDVPMNAFEFVA